MSQLQGQGELSLSERSALRRDLVEMPAASVRRELDDDGRDGQEASDQD